MRTVTLVLATAALCIHPAFAQAPVAEVESLQPPSAQSNDRMGSNVQISDTQMCTGIPNRSVPLTAAGAVATWPRVGGTFGAPSLLSSPMPSGNGEFGVSIELEGNELMVSESRTLLFGSPARGAVHHYVDQGAGWTYVGSVHNHTVGNNAFGRSIDRDGDLLAVGAPQESNLASLRGAVYLYRWVAGSWQSEGVLTASDGGSGHRFGVSVAVDSGRVLVGAPARPIAGMQVGAAYCYEKIGGVWVETEIFTRDPLTTDLGMGASVDLTDDTAVVCASRTNDPGSAYIYARTGSNWNLVERLRPDNLGNFATFGHSVALQGDQLVIGAYQDSVVGTYTGSAWVFERNMGSFVPSVRLVHIGPTAFFGFAVGLDGAGTYVVGRPNGQALGAPAISGEIFAYRPDNTVGTAYCSSATNSTQRQGRISAFGSEVAGDDWVRLVAHQLPNNSFGIFLTSQSQGFLANPGGSQGDLCLGGALGRYNLPTQIGNSGQIGTFSLGLNLNQTPTPFGPVTILSGQTWHFQAWYRDLLLGHSVSNFTDALSIAFQ